MQESRQDSPGHRSQTSSLGPVLNLSPCTHACSMLHGLRVARPGPDFPLSEGIDKLWAQHPPAHCSTLLCLHAGCCTGCRSSASAQRQTPGKSITSSGPGTHLLKMHYACVQGAVQPEGDATLRRSRSLGQGQPPLEGRVAPPNSDRAGIDTERLFSRRTFNVGIRSLPPSPRQQALQARRPAPARRAA